MNGGPREGFHVGFLAIAPAFSFNRAFIRLPPPSLRRWRYAGGFDGGLPYYSACVFLQILFFAFFLAS